MIIMHNHLKNLISPDFKCKSFQYLRHFKALWLWKSHSKDSFSVLCQRCKPPLKSLSALIAFVGPWFCINLLQTQNHTAQGGSKPRMELRTLNNWKDFVLLEQWCWMFSVRFFLYYSDSLFLNFLDIINCRCRAGR